MKLIILSILTVFLSACISTQVRDFTDPDYIEFSASKLLIEAPNHLFAESFAQELEDINVIHSPSSKLFMPTRTYTAKQKLEIMRKEGYDSLLTISISGDDQSRNVVGYNTNSYASANAYNTGHGNAYAYGSGTSTTTTIVSHKRSTQAQAKLYDIKTGRTIWVGDLDTAASGSLYMSNSSTVNSITEKIVSSLIQKGHFEKKIPNK